jgi:Family of unknown function (DUF6069)
METQKPTITQALKGGLIAGAIAAPANVAWNFIAQSLGSVAPPNFLMGVILSSILPLLIGSILYFLLVKFTANGKMIFLVVSGLFILVSLYGPMQPVMPDGTATPEGFALLTIPMHLIAGGVAMWGIPKFAK